MPDFRKVAKDFINNNLWVIPVNAAKKPSCRGWFDFQTRPMTDKEIDQNFKNCHGIALLCGGPTKIELLDWDMKYDLSSDFYDRVKKEIPVSIKKKMLVGTTKNDGFHWWYRVEKEDVEPNQKLANRYTTPYEKHIVYLDNFKNPETRDNAMKIAINDSHRVLVETRGGTEDRCGGYGLISPTKDYKIVYKPKGGIQTITSEERDILFSIIREYNEVIELDINKKTYDGIEWELGPFEDYNERGDALGLLYECGWTESESGSPRGNVRLLRPGATGSSALYDLTTNVFKCFSTSTRFETNKAYSASSVFKELECDGDASLAYSKLINLGYGIKKK